MPLLTTEIFIQRAKLKHGNIFDYSKSVYIDSRTELEIICPIHGSFWQIARAHLFGKKCHKCGGSDLLTVSEVNLRFLNLNSIYDYTKVKYIDSKTKVEIVCPIHGSFWQTPEKHWHGRECPPCSLNKSATSRTKTTEKFIEESIKIHGPIFDFSKAIYIRADKNIEIICLEHGSFWQLPMNHIQGRNGCPICKSSKGEEAIRLFLIENNIEYKNQVRFKNCKNKKPLPFDFGIYKNDNLLGLIEYQGEQHYIPRECFGGIKRFNIVKKHDQIKRTFAKNNNIPYLEICYKDLKKVNQKLLDFINY
jgi:hypothetical protein